MALRNLRQIAGEDDGAVTVDWVVLTAALMGLGLLTYYNIFFGTQSVAENLKTRISEVPVGGQ